jgi:MFS family permease
MWFRKDKKPAPAAGDNNAAALPTHEVENDNTMEPITTVSTSGRDFEYPKGIHLALLLTSLFVSIFIVALDRMIIATAIPAITDEFKSLPDVGWYGSAYLLTTCSFQLLFGKLYTFWAVKTIWLSSIVIFEIGSAICGAAPNSTALIIGRAVQGVGGAGIFSGAIVTIVYAVPLEKRPLYQGMFGAVFGLASILGPLIGGAFTSNVTWRWCFYINLPIGGVAFVISAFLLRIPDRDTTQLPLREKLAQLDAAGTTLLIPGVVALLLALQWGGLTYAVSKHHMKP